MKTSPQLTALLLASLAMTTLSGCDGSHPRKTPTNPSPIGQITFHVIGMQKTASGAT